MLTAGSSGENSELPRDLQWSVVSDAAYHHCVVCEVLDSTYCQVYSPFSLQGLAGVPVPMSGQKPLILKSVIASWARGPPLSIG